MFTFEIRINGSLVAHVYGHNEGSGTKGRDRYRFEYYQTETRRVVNGEVQHRRGDGIRKLICSILEEADKAKPDLPG